MKQKKRAAQVVPGIIKAVDMHHNFEKKLFCEIPTANWQTEHCPGNREAELRKKNRCYQASHFLFLPGGRYIFAKISERNPFLSSHKSNH